jgi:hypothetical protein
MAGRQQDYYTLARNHNKAIWDGINALVALQREWNALDYGNTLEPGAGANEGLTDTDIGAVVFDTANAMVGVLNAGHATNMAKLLP